MGKDIVLTAGFTHDSRIGNVGFNVFCLPFSPKILEHSRGSGEVHTGKILMGEQNIADLGTAAWDEVDDALWEDLLL